MPFLREQPSGVWRICQGSQHHLHRQFCKAAPKPWLLCRQLDLQAYWTGTSDNEQPGDFDYHGMMFGIFAMRYSNTVSNGESGVGQYDIVVPDRANDGLPF